MAFIDELMKLQGNQMGGTPVANPMMAPQPILMQPPQVATQATPQAPQLTPEQRARVEGSRASSEQPIESNIFKGAGGAALGGLGRATGATALGESMGEYYGAQKYGTGIAADGSLTGQPRTPNTLAGQGLTLAATGLEYLGDATTGAKTTAGGIATGLGHVGEYLTGADLVEGGVVKTPTAPTQQAAPEPSVFQHTNAPLPSASIGQVSAPSPFEQPPTQNPMLTPQIEQEYAPQRPDVIAGTPFPSAPAPSLAQQLPESGTEQFLDPQGRLRRRDIGTGELTEQYSEYEKQAAAREQRAEEQFGVARGPDARDRDTGEMSMADAVDLAGGDREKARAMVVASRQTQGEVDDGLTPYQRANLDWQKQKFTAEQASKGLDRALKEAKSDEERTQIRQEMETKENDLYNLHQDSFDRQERYINQALENTGLLSTGFASISKFMPGTPARQLEESLKPILGEAAFGRLQQMRDASKTGGALGQVSERELGLLESAMGALSTSQNESQFRANLLAYRKQLRESHARIQEQYKEMRAGGSSGGAKPRYENDQDFADSAESYYNPSK